MYSQQTESRGGGKHTHTHLQSGTNRIIQEMAAACKSAAKITLLLKNTMDLSHGILCCWRNYCSVKGGEGEGEIWSFALRPWRYWRVFMLQDGDRELSLSQLSWPLSFCSRHTLGAFIQGFLYIRSQRFMSLSSRLSALQRVSSAEACTSAVYVPPQQRINRTCIKAGVCSNETILWTHSRAHPLAYSGNNRGPWVCDFWIYTHDESPKATAAYTAGNAKLFFFFFSVLRLLPNMKWEMKWDLIHKDLASSRSLTLNVFLNVTNILENWYNAAWNLFIEESISEFCCY